MFSRPLATMQLIIIFVFVCRLNLHLITLRRHLLSVSDFPLTASDLSQRTLDARSLVRNFLSCRYFWFLGCATRSRRRP